MSEERDGITVFGSFYKAAQKMSREDRLSFFEALLDYAFTGVTHEDVTPVADAVLEAIKPVIDGNAADRANGRKGGRPRKETPVPENEKPRFVESENPGFENPETDKIGNDRTGKEETGEITTTLLTARGEEKTLGDVMTLYMEHVQANPSPQITDLLKGYCETLTPAVVCHAVERAIENNVLKWSYIRPILQGYERDKLTTLELVMRKERERADEMIQSQSRRRGARDAPPEPEPPVGSDIERMRRNLARIKAG